jgi:hypothetical protein
MPKSKTVNSTSVMNVVDQNILDAAVDFINETANETIYNGSLKIGEYILEHIFDNDLKLATSRNPKKKDSFNKLCEREDLTVPPSRLSLMVRVASQERFFVEKKVDVGSLTYTHKASLVKLDDNTKKLNLIKKCFEEEMTTRKLEEEIKKMMDEIASPKSPSLIQTTQKYMKRVDTILETVDDDSLDIDEDELSKMTVKRLDSLESHVNDLKAKVKKAAERTESLTSGCDTLLEKLDAVKKEKKKNPPKRGRKPKVQKK